jgi:integral membrane sensor domain MASE1
MSATNYRNKLLSLLSVCGILFSCAIYVATFLRPPIFDDDLLWFVPLLVCAIALALPIRFIEPASTRPNYLWTDFLRGRPRWTFPCIILLGLVAAFNLILATGEKHGDSGQVNARAFASIIIAMYFVPATYWWFKRSTK